MDLIWKEKKRKKKPPHTDYTKTEDRRLLQAKQQVYHSTILIMRFTGIITSVGSADASAESH